MDKNDACEDILQKHVKKGVKKPKKWIFPQTKLQIKTTKPLIKNPSRYVFYNFDKILKQNIFFHFGPKMTPVRYFTKKKQISPFFKFQMGIKMCKNFCPENFFSPKSANAHIFELLKRWGLWPILKAKYENSLGGPLFS